MLGMLLKAPSRKTWLLLGAFGLFYLVTVVPVGLFLYSLKSNNGVNVFSKGGYHTYLKCLAVSVELMDMPEAKPTPDDVVAPL